jgi:hypothetical protein
VLGLLGSPVELVRSGCVDSAVSSALWEVVWLEVIDESADKERCCCVAASNR